MTVSDSQTAGAAPQVPSRRLVVGALVVLLLVVGGLVYWNRDASSAETPGLTQAAVDKSVDAKLADAAKKAAAAPPHSASVYRAIAPSMVFIRVSRPAAADGEAADAATDEAEAPSEAPSGAAVPDSAVPDDTTPGDVEPDEARRGLGSGVVVNQDGDILTANHVVDGATTIEVTFADGTSSPAEIASAEPDEDIAVLKAQRLPEVVVPAVLGGGVQVGDEAFTVGHPLGLVGSLSAGVISGLNRSIPVDEENRLEGLIQFDAAVNPGSSGGPLLNRAGQVVGIVTALANPSEQGFFVGIGFAVPIATAGGAAGGPPV